MKSKPSESLQAKILEAHVWYRVLNIPQLLTLTERKDERHLRVQLDALSTKGYVYRRSLPLEGGGRHPSASQLLPEGKRFLQESGIEVPYFVPTLQKLQAQSPMHLLHTIRVNDVFLLLYALTRQYPNRFKLLSRIHEREMSQYLTRSDGGVEPDGFVLMEIYRQNKKDWRRQGIFIEYERTTSFADMGKYKDKIRNYLRLFENTYRLKELFGDEQPRLMTIVDTPERVVPLTTYCTEVLTQMQKRDQEYRFRFTHLDLTRSPLEFFCSERWLRAWLPIPPAIPFFLGHEDLLYSSPSSL